MTGYKNYRPCLKIIKKYVIIVSYVFYNSQNIIKFCQNYALIQ